MLQRVSMAHKILRRMPAIQKATTIRGIYAVQNRTEPKLGQHRAYRAEPDLSLWASCDVGLEEVPWHQRETNAEVGHERQVLLARDVLFADTDPSHDVLVQKVLAVGKEEVEVLLIAHRVGAVVLQIR